MPEPAAGLAPALAAGCTRGAILHAAGRGREPVVGQGCRRHDRAQASLQHGAGGAGPRQCRLGPVRRHQRPPASSRAPRPAFRAGARSPLAGMMHAGFPAAVHAGRRPGGLRYGSRSRPWPAYWWWCAGTWRQKKEIRPSRSRELAHGGGTDRHLRSHPGAGPDHQDHRRLPAGFALFVRRAPGAFPEEGDLSGPAESAKRFSAATRSNSPEPFCSGLRLAEVRPDDEQGSRWPGGPRPSRSIGCGRPWWTPECRMFSPCRIQTQPIRMAMAATRL